MAGIPVEILDSGTGEWTEHPRFKGILIKNLLTREHNALANVNVVRVPTGGVIGDHHHGTQVETIYVLKGQSILTVEDREIPFNAGQIVAMPIGVPHSLRNEGEAWVELLTIFTPPL
jgi:quercetin dioxygenase-like cupin family protein